jgi:fibronectin-binding autotransporter adhesin
MKSTSATTLLCFALTLATASAADVFKANNTTALTEAASWLSGGPPGASDIAVWDAPLAGNTSALGATMTWGGIKLLNPGGNANISPTTGATLSLGASGINLGTATRNLTLNAAMTPIANQTWSVNASQSLTLAGHTGGAGITITRTGEGTLNLNNTATNSNFLANLVLNNGQTRAVNASGAQEFSGAISGAADFVKTGNGTLVLSGNNSGFTGNFNITGAGPLHLKNANALGKATVNFTTPAGSTLDNTTGAPLTLASGTTILIASQVTFLGTDELNLGQNPITIDGSRTLTLNGRGLSSAGTITADAGGLTKAGPGTLTILPGATVALNGKLTVTSGLLRITGGTLTCGTGTAANVELTGGSLELSGGQLATASIVSPAANGSILFNGGTIKAMAAQPSFISGLSAARISSAPATFDIDGWLITIPQPLSKDPALGTTPDAGLFLTDTFGNGTLTLTGNNTYTGPTVIQSGTLAIGPGGSISQSSTIDIRTDGTFNAGTATTLASGQSLQGTGTITGNLTVGPGATLAPAGNTIGTLLANDTLTLLGNTAIQINKSGTVRTSDQLNNLFQLTYGGTLTVTATGSTLALGDRFQLFNSLNYAGTFSQINLPTLPAGLFWEISDLTTDGSIRVINTLPSPTFTPPAGAYIGQQTVTISGYPGSTIHYTTDGSDPITSPTRISTPTPATGLIVPADSSAYTIRAYASVGVLSSTVRNSVYQMVDNGVWNHQTSGNWSDTTKWLYGLIAQGTGILADFSTQTLNGPSTINLDGSRMIGRLKFADVGGFNSWTLTGSPLTLNNGVEKPTIHVENATTTITAPLIGTSGFVKTGAGNLVSQLANSSLSGTSVISQGSVMGDRTNSLGTGTILLGDTQTGSAEARIMQRGSDPWPPAADFGTTNPIIVAAGPTGRLVIGRQNSGNWASIYTSTITLNNNVIFRHEGADRLSIEGKITGTGNVTFEGPRTNVDNPANDYLGNTTITSGAGVQMRGGAFPPATDLTVDGRLGFDGAALTVASLSGTGVINNWTAGTRTFTLGSTAASRDASYSGVIRDSISIVKAGTATQVLSGASDFTGTTTINGGTLLINNSTGSGTGTGTVTVNSGTLGGNGIITGPIEVATSATLSPGATAATTGTLASGPLTLAGTLRCEILTDQADRISVTGNLILTGATLQVTPLGNTTAGQRTIASYTGTRTGTFNASLPPGYSLTYDDPAKQILLTVPGSGTSPYDTWATASGLTLANNDPALDPDADGVSNLLEFYLGGNPLTNDSTILPRVISITPTTITFGFTRLDAAEADFSAQTFQFTTTLQPNDWTNIPIGPTNSTAPNGVTVTVLENDTAADTIQVTIPRTLAPTRLFARLHLTQ